MRDLITPVLAPFVGKYKGNEASFDFLALVLNSVLWRENYLVGG
jgi:hypothetical protein